MRRKPNPGETLWSEALVARLSELWLSGTTSGEIGRRLGITRSAVMGKLRRLDLLCRDRPEMPIVRRSTPLLKNARNIEQVSKRPNKRPMPPPEPYRAPPPPPSPPIGSFDLADLRHGHCRWPSGDRAPYKFCGAKQTSQSSYCSEHAQLSLSRGSQRDFDRAAEAALGGKLFASRAGIEQ